MNEWVVLELSPKADGEDPDLIRQSIRHQIRDAEVYLPVSVTKLGDDKLINYLMEGYAFVRRAHPDEKYYRLEGSRYVQTVLTKTDRSGSRPVRVLACATEADITRFKNQIFAQEDQGIEVGDTVLVTSGPYRQIQAKVIEDIPERDSVQVHVKLRSKDSLVTLPRSFLHLVEKAPRDPFQQKVSELRAWWAKSKPILDWPDSKRGSLIAVKKSFLLLDDLEHRRQRFGGFFKVAASSLNREPLVQQATQVNRLTTWMDSKTRLWAMIQAGVKVLNEEPLRQHSKQFVRLQAWAERWGRLAPLFSQPFQRGGPSLEQAYQRWLWLEDVQARCVAIEGEVRAIERAMVNPNMTHNLIIDGHNLACRCAMVPGLSTLTDGRGRPTGAIHGFLRSLGSFLKKFEGAKIYVTWDGSSQRRRGMYEGYKANRSALRASFEVEFLKGLFPLLGITQAWNPEEEADDVIATLLYDPLLKGQNNVIIGTDRDMLQCVSDTTRVYVPAVGAGKEKLYDIATVQADYGVLPTQMVHFRAIDGDSSDNIPGAPGFGPKLAAKLIQSFGTVDGIFSSTLAGLTPAQYKKLRTAEQQVRLNVRLMALHYDLPLTVLNPKPDRNAAIQRLQDVDVQPDSILKTLFVEGSTEGV